MAALLRRYWIAGLITLVPLVFVFSAARLWQDIGRLFPGFKAAVFQGPYPWVVDAATPPWWPGITETGLLPQDKLVAIAGHAFGIDQGRLYAAAYARGATSIPITILRNGRFVEVQAPLVPFSVAHYLDIKLPLWTISLVFWLLAVVVYRAQPGAAVNRSFSIVCAFVASYYAAAGEGLFPLEGDWGQRAVILTIDLISPLAASAVIHFATAFPPRPVGSPVRQPLSVVYAIGLLVGIGWVIADVARWSPPTSEVIESLPTTFFQLTAAMLGIAVIYFLARFGWLVLTEHAPRLRRQLLITSLGFAFALPALILLIVAAFMPGVNQFLRSGLNLNPLLLAIPLAFAFVILRYQTFRSAQPLYLIVFILAGSYLAAEITAWVLRLLQPEITALYAVPPNLPLLGAFVLIGVFWSTQTSWRGVFGRLLHWKTQGYDAVRRFGQRLLGQSDLKLLPAAIVNALVRELELERASIWLWQESNATLVLAGQAGTWSQPPADLEAPARDLMAPGRPVYRQNPDHAWPEWLEPLVSGGEVAAVVPLALTDTPIGILALGKRWDEEIMDDRDLEIVELIGQQATLFLMTARQIEELRQVPQRVAEAQERERERIAGELHDTIQQFLGRLPFFLEVSRSELAADPAESDRILQRCIADIEKAADTVRLIRNNLTAGQLDKGLLPPLHDLVERFRLGTDTEIHLDHPQGTEPPLSLQSRLALYRVIQQALDNIAEHAEASRVDITLTETDGRLHFAVTDDGRGSSEAERTMARADGSFGLRSMEARVQAVGGEFVFSSAPQEGTRVSGWLPTTLNLDRPTRSL